MVEASYLHDRGVTQAHNFYFLFFIFCLIFTQTHFLLICAWHKVFKSSTCCRKNEHQTKYCAEKRSSWNAAWPRSCADVCQTDSNSVSACEWRSPVNKSFWLPSERLWNVVALSLFSPPLVYFAGCTLWEENRKPGGAKWLIRKNITGDFTQDLKQYLPLQGMQGSFWTGVDSGKLYWSCSFGGKAINFALH